MSKTKKRTEVEKCLQKFSIRLGGVDREVGVRSVRGMVELRQKIAGVLGEVASCYEEGVKEEDMVKKILPMLFTHGIDVIMDLPVLYAPELKDVCENEATDEELINAGYEVLDVIFPFVQTAAIGMMEVVARFKDATSG